MWARVQRHIAGLVRQLCSGSRVGTTRRSTRSGICCRR